MAYTILTVREAMDQYRDMLDDSSRPMEVGGHTLPPSLVLEKVMPISFRCGFLDFIDSLTYADTYVQGYTDSEIPEPDPEGKEEEFYTSAEEF